MESHSQDHVVGASVPRVDAQAKVTGQAVFMTDLNIPGMVHAKLWRSPLPHSRIRGIDTSAAAAGRLEAGHFGEGRLGRLWATSIG